MAAAVGPAEASVATGAEGVMAAAGMISGGNRLCGGAAEGSKVGASGREVEGTEGGR